MHGPNFVSVVLGSGLSVDVKHRIRPNVILEVDDLIFWILGILDMMFP